MASSTDAGLEGGLSHPPPSPIENQPSVPASGRQDTLESSANETDSDLLLLLQSPADVSSDLSWLGPLIDDGARIISGPDLEAAEAAATPATPATPTTPETSTPAACTGTASNVPLPASPVTPTPTASDLSEAPKISTQTPRHTPIDDNNNNTTTTTTSPPANTSTESNNTLLLANRQPTRKLSPGLAARLKALGLDGSKQPEQPTAADLERVGRLPEDQIRQIDEFHQQRSADLVIERRGRPWKGVVVRIPSRTSLKSSKSSKDAVTPEDVDVPTIRIVDSPSDDGGDESHPSDPTYPDFEAPEALDMDTNKYRLPDHTNGNGTKVTLDTRKEHLERDTRPPPSPEESPPPVPAKDTPPIGNQPFNPDDYFNPLGLQRPGSIYTISRASFANQLAQLTSLQLPDAESLAGKVAAIPTAQAAVKALIGAAEQIRSWISKASEVISGLDGDDDVEWSAAGGREGLEEVENATTKFEGLINVYVTSIEQLQNRADIVGVSADDLTKAVMQMEAIMEEWTNIRTTLRVVRGQVEIAMEWEELWNTVLGEIESELDELRRLVFEMEERRHKSAMATASGDAVDMGDLETIAEETPPAGTRARAAKNRMSLTGLPTSPGSPTPGGPSITADDSSLLALFARMQPLRASLDFLPMRLSTFESRAEKAFPTACEELDMRREGLEASYKKLEKDAEGLRKELGEDRWVLVFRGAARQAQKMTDSVDRSVERLKEAVDTGMQLTNPPGFLKKLESYEAKKTHYGPAIDRVLLIIERGVKDRLTVNGEILRLHNEMQAKWEDLKNQIKDMDMSLDELHTDRRGNNLRDSISSMLSNDMMSTVGSGVETPGSSPPSSVIMSGLGIDTRTPGSKGTVTRARRSSSSVSNNLPQAGRRTAPTATPSVPRKPVPRLSTYGGGLSTPSRESSANFNANRAAGSIPRPASTMAHRPKWNGSTNTSHIDTGHNFKPLSLTNPSPFARKTSASSSTPTPVRSHSSLAAPMNSKLPMMRSPLRAASPSPGPETPPKPVSKLNLLQAPAGLGQRRTSLLQPSRHEELGLPPRAQSSMATSRRTSMLPMPKFRKEVTDGGRVSPAPGSFGSRFGLKRGNSISSKDKTGDNKPRWRH